MKWLKGLFKRRQVADERLASERLMSGDTVVGSSRRSSIRQLPFKDYLPLVGVAATALMAADLATTYVRSYMIPTTSPAAKPPTADPAPFRTRNEFDEILARNIFNSDGLIPGNVEEQTVVANEDGTARESQLPLSLVGTIVHADPGRSVATIEQKGGGADNALPYKPNEDVLGVATLIKVERKKAFIRNNSTRGLEYLVIKDDPAIEFQKRASVTKDGIVMKEGDDTFALNRNDLNAQMDNLQELLTQALALPNEVPGVGTDGFRIVNIQPDSLFSKLGIKDNDVIKFVDGEKVDSVAKAMDLYNALKSRSSIKIQIDRGGRLITQTYNIK